MFLKGAIFKVGNIECYYESYYLFNLPKNVNRILSLFFIPILRNIFVGIVLSPYVSATVYGIIIIENAAEYLNLINVVSRWYK